MYVDQRTISTSDICNFLVETLPPPLIPPRPPPASLTCHKNAGSFLYAFQELQAYSAAPIFEANKKNEKQHQEHLFGGRGTRLQQ